MKDFVFFSKVITHTLVIIVLSFILGTVVHYNFDMP